MKNYTNYLLTMATALSGFLCPTAIGEEEESLLFTTPEGWRGETIALPPEFAPAMKVVGSEVIRFAPGMFDPKSDSFFSYIFVFAVDGDAVFTEDTIRDEILVYYRGLAESVLKGKGKEVDAETFTFEMEVSGKALHLAVGAGKNVVTEYQGILDWVEPFATAEAQKLHFEMHAWSDAESKRSYLVVGTSPKEIGDGEGIWGELRKIREGFRVGE